MFQLIKPGLNIDFMGKRFIFIGISIAAILGTVGLFFTRGLNYGIDFTGGAEVQVRVPRDWDTGRVRTVLEQSGVRDSRVQQIADPNVQRFLIKVQGDSQSLNQAAKTIETALAKQAQAGDYVIERTDVVGPAAGSSLRTSGFLSMFYALVCILIYVTIRFDFRYAPGAVLALFHDTVITLGIYMLTRRQFDLQILAALLALIGYSNNDTIIVFDRVRETLHHHPGLKIEDAVNRSVNETLGRTLLTSLSTFFTVFALWLFGGKVIEDFAFTLMIGIVVGTYSSIVIASSVLIVVTHYQERSASRTRSIGARARRT